jgi:hypothetical protein
MRSVVLTLFVLLPGLAVAQIPVLSVSTARLQFITSGTSQLPPSQQVRIRNAGSGSLTWSATTTTAWLRLSPVEGAAPGVLTVTIDTAQLAVGDYNGRITVSAIGDADDSPASIDVSLKLVAASKAPPEPVSVAPPAQPATPTTPQTNPQSADARLPQVNLSAPASSRLLVPSTPLPAATRNLPYSQALPISGGTPPYAVQILQGRLPPGLVLANGAISGVSRIAGAYQFAIGVMDSSAPPQKIAQLMSLRVLALSQNTALMVAPPSVAIVIAGNQRQQPMRLSVASGGQPLGWHATTDATWLRLIPSDGVSPGVLQLEVVAQGLAVGSYVATVTVMMEGVPNSPARIPVQLVVRR